MLPGLETPTKSTVAWLKLLLISFNLVGPEDLGHLRQASNDNMIISRDLWSLCYFLFSPDSFVIKAANVLSLSRYICFICIYFLCWTLNEKHTLKYYYFLPYTLLVQFTLYMSGCIFIDTLTPPLISLFLLWWNAMHDYLFLHTGLYCFCDNIDVTYILTDQTGWEIEESEPREFEPWSSLTNDLKIDTCHFLAWHAALLG